MTAPEASPNPQPEQPSPKRAAGLAFILAGILVLTSLGLLKADQSGHLRSVAMAHAAAEEAEHAAIKLFGSEAANALAGTQKPEAKEPPPTVDQLRERYAKQEQIFDELRKKLEAASSRDIAVWTRFVNPDSDLYAAYRFVQLLGWLAIVLGLLRLFSESSIKLIKDVEDMFKLGKSEAGGSAIAFVLVGSMTAGTLYWNGTLEPAPAVASPAQAAGKSGKPSGMPSRTDLDDIAAQLRDTALQLTSLDLKLEDLKTPHTPNSTQDTPRTVELSEHAENTIINNTVTTASALRQLEQSLKRLDGKTEKITTATARIETLAAQANTTADKTDTEVRKMHTEFDGALKQTDGKVVQESEVTRELAVRQAVARWAALVNGRPSKFDRNALTNLSQVQQLNHRLDEFETYQRNRNVFRHLYESVFATEWEDCLRDTLPSAPNDADCPPLPQIGSNQTASIAQ